MTRKRRDGVVTVNDVAVRAGVSPGTVSKALNGRGQLRAETRQRVVAAAEELGFHVNMLARNLLEGRTYTVGVLTTDSFGRFTIPVMLGAEDALGAGQISVLLCDGRGDRIREQHYVRTLLAAAGGRHHRHRPTTDPRPSLGRDLPVPMVYARARSDSPEDLSLMPTNQQGAGLAIRHLLATGRRRIAHITGPDRHLAARDRAAGARPRWRRRGGRGARRATVRGVERAVGPGGGHHADARPGGVQRDLLRQRPDRPRRRRRAARGGSAGARGGRHRRRGQLGGDGRGLPTAVDHRGPEPERAGHAAAPSCCAPSRAIRWSRACN